MTNLTIENLKENKSLIDTFLSNSDVPSAYYNDFKKAMIAKIETYVFDEEETIASNIEMMMMSLERCEFSASALKAIAKKNNPNSYREMNGRLIEEGKKESFDVKRYLH